jgi:hypothetical protein
MRPLVVLALVSPLLAGCTPYMPMRTDFGVSALAPAGDIPPEFAAFNAYDPGLNPVMAAQLCATRFDPRETATTDAQPGQLVTTRGTCAAHIPIIGN